MWIWVPAPYDMPTCNNKLEELGYTIEDKGNIEVPIQEMCKITDPRLKYIDCIIPMGRRIGGRGGNIHSRRALSARAWAAITVCRWVRFAARRNIKSSASSGWMRTPISTLPKQRLLEIFTGCRSRLYADSVTRALSRYGMKRLRSWTRSGWPLSERGTLTRAKSATCVQPV